MARFDFVVIGAGAGGEAAVHAAAARGRTVAVVDRELFGGSCAYWACMPSKSLLHSAARHLHGGYTWQQASDRRDYMINRERTDWPDDSGHVHDLEAAGARLYRGQARIAGPGVELATVFARFGVEVSLVHSHERLLERDHARCSEAAGRILRDDGVELRLGVRATRVRPRAGKDDHHVVELSDGGYVEGERILVALGRSFGLERLGFETVDVDARAIQRDGRLRVADGLYLIGDPAGPELFTHVSHYQGNLAVRMALGEDVTPDYRAIPRAVYIDPEIASVGLSAEQARAAGVDSFEEVADFATTARGYELEAKFGHLAIVVDRASRTLIGGSVVAPDASAAIHEITLAIQARVPVSVLAGMLHGFPSTSRAFDGLFASALSQLPQPVRV